MKQESVLGRIDSHLTAKMSVVKVSKVHRFSVRWPRVRLEIEVPTNSTTTTRRLDPLKHTQGTPAHTIENEQACAGR